MFVTDETVDVTMLCDNMLMKSVVDKFGMGIKTKSVGAKQFRVTVKVCPSPTFYRWIFGAGGKFKIERPADIREEYRNMLLSAIEGL